MRESHRRVVDVDVDVDGDGDGDGDEISGATRPAGTSSHSGFVAVAVAVNDHVNEGSAGLARALARPAQRGRPALAAA